MVCELGISWKKNPFLSPAPSLATKDVVSENPFKKILCFRLYIFLLKMALLCSFFSATFEIHFLRAKDPRSCSHFLPKARLVVKTKIPFFRQKFKIQKILNRIKCAMMPFRLFLS